MRNKLKSKIKMLSCALVAGALIMIATLTSIVAGGNYSALASTNANITLSNYRLSADEDVAFQLVGRNVTANSKDVQVWARFNNPTNNMRIVINFNPAVLPLTLTPQTYVGNTIFPTNQISAEGTNVGAGIIVLSVSSQNAVNVAGHLYNIGTLRFPTINAGEHELRVNTAATSARHFVSGSSTEIANNRISARNFIAFFPPSSPTNLTAVADDLGRVDLAWTAPTNNGNTPITRHEFSINGGASWVATQNATSHRFQANAAQIGVELSFIVRAVNIEGASVASNIARATPEGTLAAAPADFIAVAGPELVVLRWTAVTSAEANGLAIIRHEVSSDSGETWVIAMTSSLHTFVDLEGGVLYTFKVRAVNSLGIAGHTSKALATTQTADGETAPCIACGCGTEPVECPYYPYEPCKCEPTEPVCPYYPYEPCKCEPTEPTEPCISCGCEGASGEFTIMLINANGNLLNTISLSETDFAYGILYLNLDKFAFTSNYQFLGWVLLNYLQPLEYITTEMFNEGVLILFAKVLMPDDEDSNNNAAWMIAGVSGILGLGCTGAYVAQRFRRRPLSI